MTPHWCLLPVVSWKRGRQTIQHEASRVRADHLATFHRKVVLLTLSKEKARSELGLRQPRKQSIIHRRQTYPVQHPKPRPGRAERENIKNGNDRKLSRFFWVRNEPITGLSLIKKHEKGLPE
jgi:hypothetical protein